MLNATLIAKPTTHAPLAAVLPMPGSSECAVYTAAISQRLVELTVSYCENPELPGARQGLQRLLQSLATAQLGDALPEGTTLADLACFLLKERRSRSYAEIGALLGCSRECVAAHIARMRESLIDALF